MSTTAAETAGAPGAPAPEAQGPTIVGRSPWQLFWHRFRQDRFALTGLGFIGLLVLLAIFAPAVAALVGHGPNELFGSQMLDIFGIPNGPNSEFWFGADNSGRDVFTRLVNPRYDEHQWSRVEILVDPSTGVARMAVAQPVDAPAVEVLVFKDPTAGQKGPFALQMHNKGLFDEFANIAVEVDPPTDDLLTTTPGPAQK